jgi:predicted esterase
MSRILAARGHYCALFFLSLGAWLATASAGKCETLTLKNGMVLEGSVGNIASIGADPAAGGSELKQIYIIDNGLTRTFVGSNQILPNVDTKPLAAIERIKVPQRVAVSGRTIGSVGPIIHFDPFDEYGRRTFSMRTDQGGQLDVVQGITEITPKWTEVKAIQGASSYVWTMRIATSSIPREQLSKILYRVMDPKNSDNRLRIVNLYLQGEQFQEARDELAQVLKDFPELANLQDQVKRLRQLNAQRLIKEIDLRLEAGQFTVGIPALQQFPADGIDGGTLLKVREMLEEMAGYKAAGLKVLTLMAEHLAQVKEEKTRDEAKKIVAEITRELNVNTLDRMADYLRLADDPKMEAEQKLSLAISGWFLGSGSGIDSLAMSTSLLNVRELVRQYLVETQKPRRDEILIKLASLEGATPKYVAQIIVHMRPPLQPTVTAPPNADVGNPAGVLGLPTGETQTPAAPKSAPATEEKSAEKKAPHSSTPEEDCAPKKDDSSILDNGPKLPPREPPAVRTEPKTTEPKAAANEPKPAAEAPPAPAVGTATATKIEGLFELTVKGLPEDPEIKYLVQLPPDYDPYRKYPCVVTLNGAGTTPEQQIDFWAGAYSADAQMRKGQGTRHGYIVVAPRWTREHQRKYEYSSREWAAVLYTLRDAYKRFAIDTDRVFLSGHSMGGDAAWDMGISHPSLWAGVIPIVAVADKYVTLYYKNAKYVSFYFVCGEKDGNKRAVNAIDWDRYLRYNGYDTMVVEYQGRGHEGFHDEIQNIFTWMNLHKRNFFPKEFEVYSLRPWDYFFWWVENSKPLDANTLLPAEWGDKPPRAAKTEGKILPTNGVSVSPGGRGATVWLSPEMVTFENRASASIAGKRQTNIQPTVPVLLEDVRTRGDRQHPFWAKAEN